MSESIYFASKPPKETAAIILQRANAWYNQLYNNGYLSKVKDCWMAYHGNFNSGNGDGHKITFGGEQGELVNITINHLRNIGQHILEMITSNRPAMQVRATNTDFKSIAQTRLAENLLDYYMRDKRLEKYLKRAVEYAICLGAGYIKIEWNSTSGEVYEVNPETNTPIYEGDAIFKNLSPFDVVMDMSKDTSYDHDWVICRSFKNKFDLAAKYPELGNKIKGMQTKSDIYRYRIDLMSYDDTDEAPIYEFYHKRTESMPDGRYLLFLDDDTILMDTAMPYRDLPIFRISPSDILGTPYGYTPLFDLMPLQEAINSLHSIIITNQNAFGVQNIYVPRQADISMKSLEGGLNIIEGNAGAGKPEPLNLTSTPVEIFNYVQTLERTMETLSGVNSVVRGNPEASLKSGAALALVQSQTLQFMSGLQQQYVELIEDVGTALLNMLRDFAAVPRLATIAGKSNKAFFQEFFTGDDLSEVNRVIVEMGNALAKCLKKGTLVLMFDGSTKKVEDIQINDKIMGPDSLPRTVVNINSGQEEMFDVFHKKLQPEFLYGCNESHILSLKYCSNDGRYGLKKDQIIDISVKEYNSLSKRFKRLLMGFRSGVEFPKKSLSIPPYILGCWLGDGHSASPTLTSMDYEIINEWKNYAISMKMEIREQSDNISKATTYFITSGKQNGRNDRNVVTNLLREMNLIDNKHIPQDFLLTSREDRLNLLAGLIDTDGTLVDKSTFVITQKNNTLSENIIFLSKSLGFKTTFRKINSYSQNGTEGEYNSITIGGNTWEIPTKLERKQAKFRKLSRNPLSYGIKLVSTGVDTYYGFTLKEEPHFILGDFTVTHNTTAGKLEIAKEMMQYGLIKNPEDFTAVMETGRLDIMTDETYRELLSIRLENERLSDAKDVQVLAVDNHKMHIVHHKTLLSDPNLRFDDKFSSLILNHIQEHINQLRTADPALLTLIGEQPIGPVGGNPPSQQGPPDINQSQAPNPQQGPLGPPPGPGQLPNIPQLPEVPANLLQNPSLQENTLGNVK